MVISSIVFTDLPAKIPILLIIRTNQTDFAKLWQLLAAEIVVKLQIVGKIRLFIIR